MNKKNVLLVTRNIPLADFLAIELGKEGWSVFVAPDVNSGRFLVQTEDPRLVVVDALLPNGSASVFLSWLKEACATTPRTVLTTIQINTSLTEQATLAAIRQDADPIEISKSLSNLLHAL